MTDHLTLTLADIRKQSPCGDGWARLLRSLGYTYDRHDPDRRVSIGDIARSNDADDALWCLRCLTDTVEVRRSAMKMILPSVKRATAHATDKRVHDCIDAVERWAAGDEAVDLPRAAAEAACRGDERAAKAACLAAKAACRAAAAAWWEEETAAAAMEARKVSPAEWDVERLRQVADIIAVSPLLALEGAA